MDLYDYRYPLSKEKLLNYDVILLAGGHVPTQNHYFKEIDLKEKIKDFQGIVIVPKLFTYNLKNLEKHLILILKDGYLDSI